MTSNEQKISAKKFVEFWTRADGSEKSECHQFWDSLLGEVLGVGDLKSFIRYEAEVFYNDGSTKFLDGWIPSTRVLIEQKSRGVSLDAPQAGHAGQTPFQQAWEYDNNRPAREKARWIVVCNFDEIRIHDMEADRPETTFVTIKLAELPKEVHRLEFLVKRTDALREKELDVSIKAGRVVGKLYNAFLEQYGELAKDPEVLKNLNKLCVRLVFCVYAEDAGVFAKDQFLNFLRRQPEGTMHLAITELFKVLRLRPEERGIYFSDELKAFPYVGGGLFRDDVLVPPFSAKTASILLDDASEQFDWGDISPTIFGAVFESTLNPETRRKGGMHYTSEENIHKVIDPLFLDDLKAKLADLKAEPNLKRRDTNLEKFQQDLGELRFLDPACGSGNFLTETYISLRKLENEALATRFRGQGQLLLEDRKLIHVSINQFYGIEINDFAVTVAQTAMWIAECKMMEETNEILSKNLTPLPLTDSAKIVEGNALRMDWEENLRINERLPDIHFDYIMGNPPFVGASMMSAVQKAEAVEIFGKGKRVNSIDYVGAWYYKAAPILQGRKTRAAFVSTNSITQGEQVAAFWTKLLNVYHVEIDFAWRTFVWDSEASEKAHVHVVIIGFHAPGGDERRFLRGSANARSCKILYEGDQRVRVPHINPYLINATDVMIEGRGQPLCNALRMTKGNQPSDGGNLILSQEERDALLGEGVVTHFIKSDLASCVRRYVGARDFINNGEKRYCLWLKGVPPSVYRNSKEVMQRLEAVREMRLKSTAAPTRAMAETPYLFFSTPQTEENYLCIPEVSSERRRYIPIGFLDSSVIASNKLLIVPGARLYQFGVLTSSVHMAWMRVVAGRLKSDYQYSPAVVYNTFPWPDGKKDLNVDSRNVSGASDESALIKSRIEQTAQAILDARALYPDSSLADLYDPLTMPPELRKAHQANDAAVMKAYGFDPELSEPQIVAKLFEMYAALTDYRCGNEMY